jgi:predicted protein tyrosine phosphatase
MRRSNVPHETGRGGRIHVCGLARLEAVAQASGAGAMITLISGRAVVTRPATIAEACHLTIGVSDIVVETEGRIAPGAQHVETLIDFALRWDRRSPLLIHCYAGVSRSTAAAYVALCALAPHRAEAEIAKALRYASPTATPNARLVALGDDHLQRAGRMSAAIAAIGRGEECFEGAPFSLDVE